MTTTDVLQECFVWGKVKMISTRKIVYHISNSWSWNLPVTCAVTAAESPALNHNDANRNDRNRQISFLMNQNAESHRTGLTMHVLSVSCLRCTSSSSLSSSSSCCFRLFSKPSASAALTGLVHKQHVQNDSSVVKHLNRCTCLLITLAYMIRKDLKKLEPSCHNVQSLNPRGYRSHCHPLIEKNLIFKNVYGKKRAFLPTLLILHTWIELFN